MRIRSFASMAVVGTLLCVAATAQSLTPPGVALHGERLDAVDHAERLARIALTGDLGFPMLPPVYANSPKDDLMYADRFPVGQEVWASSAGDGELPVMLSGWIPAGASGTGTPIGESFRYQVPVGYDELGPAVPLVIAYHGYGASAGSVHLQSTIDEEANARGWFYMAPTGMDDQLFGPPDSQKNVQVAIQWMLDNYNIDEDRLYMVGFSMGGGVSANFAARRRDPDGMMIAALGIVSGTYDWEQAYNTGTSGLKALMQNPYNFGGTPVQKPFRYHQASDLRFLPSTYPPLPGTLDPPESMSTNLGSLPVYLTWDTTDTVVDVVNQGPYFLSTIQAAGADVDFHTVTGTVNPANGDPAPHSWTVLDEAALFEFFEGKVANRVPQEFSAQCDLSADVSWTHLDQRFLNLFSYVDGAVGVDAIAVTAVSNATYVLADLALAGLSGPGPFGIYAESANAGNFQIRVTGTDDPPAYLLDAQTGELVTGVESDPVKGMLMKQVAGSTPLDMQLVCDPSWDTRLTTSPNPTSVGADITLVLDAPPTTQLVWLIIGLNDKLTPIKGGHVMGVELAPPAQLLTFVLGPDGDLALNATIPTAPGVAGSTFLLQTIGVDGSFAVSSLSNVWRLKIN